MIRDVQLTTNPFSAQVLEVAARPEPGDVSGGRQLAFRTNPDAAPLRPSAHHEHWGEIFHHHGAHAVVPARPQFRPQQTKRRAKPGESGHGTESMHDLAESLLRGDDEEEHHATRANALPAHADSGRHVVRVMDRHHASRADTHTTLEEGDLTITGVQRRLESGVPDDADSVNHSIGQASGLPPLAHAKVVVLAHKVHRDALAATDLLGGSGADSASGTAAAAAQGLLEHAQRFLALLDPQASQLRFAESDIGVAKANDAARLLTRKNINASSTVRAPKPAIRQPLARQPDAPRPGAFSTFGLAYGAGVARAPSWATKDHTLFDLNLRILLRRSNTRYERLLPRVVRLLDGTGSMGGFVMRGGRAMEWFRGAGLGMASSTNPLFL